MLDSCILVPSPSFSAMLFLSGVLSVANSCFFRYLVLYFRTCIFVIHACNLFAFLLRHQDHHDHHNQAQRGADTRGAKSQTGALLESRSRHDSPPLLSNHSPHLMIYPLALLTHQ
jgi:hypothetical protein